MRFSYLAYNLAQGTVKGHMEATTVADAQGELRQRGYKPLAVRPSKGMPGIESLFPSLFRVKPGDLVRFARHLASMLGSGGNLLRSLEMMEEESRSKVMRRVLLSIHKTLDEGGSLAAALKEHPLAFDPLFVSVVEVGEYSGHLGPSLEQLADIVEREQEAKKKAMRTLMYPLAIVGLSLVTMGVLMVVALPPMLSVIQQMKGEVPLVTRLTIGAFTGAKNNFVQIVIGVALLFVLVKLMSRIPRTRYAIEAVRVKAPLIGSMIVASELARFSRTMAMLLEAGVPLTTALELAMGGCKNQVMKRAFLASQESLLSGHGFTPALKKHPILPSLFVELAMIGETSNSLKRTMRDAAEAYQKETEQRLNGLLTMLEPASTLVVGAMVAIMAFSMLMPIYSGLQSFK
ncbi:MAG: type II secretion system F family protein [Chloroflexota bacterium]